MFAFLGKVNKHPFCDMHIYLRLNSVGINRSCILVSQRVEFGRLSWIKQILNLRNVLTSRAHVSVLKKCLIESRH